MVLLAISVILMIAAAAVGYEVYGKKWLADRKRPAKAPNTTTGAASGATHALSHTVNLTGTQTVRLFDVVLPKYLKQATPANSTLYLRIGGVAEWTIDATALTVARHNPNDPTDIEILLKDLDTFNDILSQTSYDRAYFMRLYFSRKLQVDGNTNRLGDFEGVLKIIDTNRAAILAEVLA